MSRMIALVLAPVVAFCVLGAPVIHAIVPHEHSHSASVQDIGMHAALRAGEYTVILLSTVALIILANVVMRQTSSVALQTVKMVDVDRGRYLSRGISKSRKFK